MSHYDMHGNPVTLDEAVKLFSQERHVGDTTVGSVRVSTVHLVMDHNWRGGCRPLIFETMVFGGEFDQEQERYSTLDEAKRGHERWVEKAKGSPSSFMDRG